MWCGREPWLWIGQALDSCPPHRGMAGSGCNWCLQHCHGDPPSWPEHANPGQDDRPQGRRAFGCVACFLCPQQLTGLQPRGFRSLQRTPETPRDDTPQIRVTTCHHQGPLCLVIWVNFTGASRHPSGAANIRREEHALSQTFLFLCFCFMISLTPQLRV